MRSSALRHSIALPVVGGYLVSNVAQASRVRRGLDVGVPASVTKGCRQCNFDTVNDERG
jgi:hypothetical protein